MCGTFGNWRLCVLSLSIANVIKFLIVINGLVLTLLCSVTACHC